jgi:hypothetical protein
MDNNDTQVRLASKRQGYSPIPCRGKRPFLSQWQTRHNVSEDEIRQWPLGNTGHLTENTPVLDCDIKDPSAAGAMAELVRDWFDSKGTILVRTGNPPKFAIPLRTPTPFPKMVETLTAPNGADYRIEVLCQGQQYIVDGIHPDTDEPYLWQGNVAPWHIHRDELPEVSPISMRELLDHMVETLIEDFGYTRTVSNGACGTHQTSANEPKPAMDLNAVVENMRPGSNFHDDQVRTVAAMLESSMSVEMVVSEQLAIAERAAAAAGETWDLVAEERGIREQAYSWIVKHPKNAHLLPTEFRQKFEAALIEGKKPRFVYRPDLKNWSVRAYPNGAEEQPTEAKPKGDLPGLPAGWRAYDGKTKKPSNWLIKGLLPEQGVLVLPGAWGSYKTTLLLTVSYSVMMGEDFAGQYRVKRTGGVLMYALEGGGTIDTRMRAVVMAAGGDGDADLPIFFHEVCPPLTRPESALEIIKDVKAADAHCRAKHGVPIRVLWIDTYSSAAGHTGSGDDNDRSATQKVFTTLHRVARETGILVAVLDHFGKNAENGTTGSSAKEGSADTVLASLSERELNGTLSDTRIVIRKQREGPSGIEIPYDAEPVVLGNDEDGDPITAMALTFGKARMAKPTRKLTDNDMLFEKALTKCLAESAFDHVADYATGEVLQAVMEEYVRLDFYDMYPRGAGDEKQFINRRAKSFADATKRAILSGRVVHQDGPAEGGASGVILYRPAK